MRTGDRFRRSTLLFVLVLVESSSAAAQPPRRPASASSPAPVYLRCQDLVTPLGLDTARPQLSWRSAATSRNWKQSAYQIIVATSAAAAASGNGNVWDSGRRDSDASHSIPYEGPALEASRRYYWSVRVWDAEGLRSPYAPVTWWETGLLQPSDWHASWIAGDTFEAAADRAGIQWIYVAGRDAAKVPLKTSVTFRVIVTLPVVPANALLVLTSRGNFVARVNGTVVNAKTRSWIAFDPEDITRELRVGSNTIDVTLVTAMPGDTRPPADGLIPSALAGLLKLTHADGRVERIPTDTRWVSRSDTEPDWAASAIVDSIDAKTFPDPGPIAGPASLLRRSFVIQKPVRSARLYATALGSYRLFLNGTRVGRDALTPDFTDYRKRALYQTYDVTAMLRRGPNAFGAILGKGWFGSPMSWYGNPYFFGAGPERLLAQLVVTYVDGSAERILTDASWKTAPSAVQQSEIYGGEIYDARRERSGWANAPFDDGAWAAAAVVPHGNPSVSAQLGLPVREIQSLRPRAVHQRDGAYIFDMGQNMVGNATLRVAGPRGTRIRLRYAEILAPDGAIYRDNLRNADATDIYVLRGGPPETYTPLFTFHGFRYVEVTGYPGTPTLDAITGQVLSSIAGQPTGRLSTASPLIDQFWRVGLWGQRGNFLSIPTDCPQRDERLGWTGDAGVFWRTGAYNFDTAAFTAKWLQDLRDAQTAAGAFPNTAPHAPELGDGAPGWGDAGVIVPWTTWMQYGNRNVIDENWAAMQQWLAYIENGNPDFIRRARVGANFSDWLAPDYRTAKPLVATAYWALIVDQMTQMAEATGRAADAERYRGLHTRIRDAFQREFLKPNGEIDPGTQTAYLLTLNMKLAPESLVPAILANLEKAIRDKNDHLATGFLGTPFLLFTLADHGRLDLAYTLLLNETYPSWGYMVAKGATTWWERWNSDTGDPAMNSYNHYAFGSVVAWVYRYVAGIDTSASEPGFKSIVIRPRPDRRLSHARGEYESVYGTIVSDWRRGVGDSFALRVRIPPNTSARVYLPARPGGRVLQDGHEVKAEKDGDSFVLLVGAGEYLFEVRAG